MLWRLIAVAALALAGPVQQTPFISKDINLVPVQLGVMSRCPDAFMCEALFSRVYSSSNIPSLIQPSNVYIGHLNETAAYGVTCKHGPSECRGNIQQLCVYEHASDWQDWWKFVTCQNYSPGRIGDDSLAKDCAKLAKVDWDTIENCLEGTQGRKLLQDSVRKADQLAIVNSCSILVNNKLACVRNNGDWEKCDSGHEVGDFVDAIKKAYDSLN